jgi:hypothetical protein
MDREEFQKAYGKIVAKAWADEDFKAKLLADPMTILEANGLAIPQDVEINVVENTDKIVYLNLPPEPAEQLSEGELEKVAGGMNFLNDFDIEF